MHKMWAEHARPHIIGTHKKAYSSFNKLAAAVAFKDRIIVSDIIEAYEKFEKPKPTIDVIIHLDKIEKEYTKLKGPELIENMKTMKKKMVAFYTEVNKLRQGVLCGVCEWHNHRYIDAEARVITYNNKFCTKIVQKFIDTLFIKYNLIIKYVLLLDELFFIITEHRLVEEHLDRAILHRYMNIIQKCKDNPDDPKACHNVCRQFNVNRFTYMFDGETKTFDKFLKNFMDAVEVLTGSKEEYLKLFSLRKKAWNDKALKRLKKLTYLSKEIKKDPTEKKALKTGLKLKFTSTQVKGYVERKHPMNSIQIELLDDEIETLTLYRLADHPVDISKFEIEFNDHGGLNLFRDSKKINLNISTQKLMALIQSKGGDASTLDEILDDSVKSI